MKHWMPSDFQCPTCSKRFETDKGLKAHKYRFHGRSAQIKQQSRKLPRGLQDDLIAQQESLFQQARERMALVSSTTEQENTNIGFTNTSTVLPLSDQQTAEVATVKEENSHSIMITEDGKVNVHAMPSADVPQNADVLQAINRLSLNRDHRMALDFILQPETPIHTEHRQVMSIGFVLQDGNASEKETLRETTEYDYPELAALDESERYSSATTVHTLSRPTMDFSLAALIQHVLNVQDFGGFIFVVELMEILIYLLPQEQLLQIATTIRPAAIAESALVSDLTEVIQNWAYLKLLACRLSGKNHIQRSPVRYTACTILHHCFILEDIIARSSTDLRAQYISSVPQENLELFAGDTKTIDFLDALAERAASRQPIGIQLTKPMVLKEILFYWEDLQDTVEDLF